MQNTYLTLIDKQSFSDLSNKKHNIICKKCNIEKIFFQTDGYYICPNCAESEHIIIENELLNIKDSICDKQKYPYKRLNHFKEKLNQFQAKESFEIPDNVINIILNYLNSQQIDVSSCDRAIIKKILQEFKLTTCYEHLELIYCKITGKPPFSLHRNVEDTLCSMFTSMQSSHDKHCPASRLNSLNYSYIIHKLFKNPITRGIHPPAKYPLFTPTQNLNMIQ